jgi:hypothetical protein
MSLLKRIFPSLVAGRVALLDPEAERFRERPKVEAHSVPPAKIRELKERIVAAMRNLGREPMLEKVAVRACLPRRETADTFELLPESLAALEELIAEGVLTGGTRGGLRLHENAIRWQYKSRHRRGGVTTRATDDEA